jgi:alkanesulfonate monooxygenase SsuD/methylene tetrahydromethanopterin reductase-like flavin-dependent oxidoreductase (luciferase family)
VRHAIFLPLFGELAEPALAAELAAEAEATGWDGVFVWDHTTYRPPVTHVGDPWVAMAAMACATDRVLLGPLVTPLSRRRPEVVARASTSLDRLSDGRFVMGVGLGSDTSRELSAFGEELDDRARARRLDEALDLLVALWSGEEVHHEGPAFRADGVRFLPTPVQPRIPVWVASRYPARPPLRRAARHDGLFPIDLDRPDQLRELLDIVEEHRAAQPGAADRPFDVVVDARPGARADEWEAAGATWWLTGFDQFTITAAEVRATVAAGPPGV